MSGKRDSILQHAESVPDLGAPKASYSIVLLTDCDPPEYALGLRMNGNPAGYVTDGAGRVITHRSQIILHIEAQMRGLPPHKDVIPGVTTG
jgi:hypothetical protein